MNVMKATGPNQNVVAKGLKLEGAMELIKRLEDIETGRYDLASRLAELKVVQKATDDGKVHIVMDASPAERNNTLLEDCEVRVVLDPPKSRFPNPATYRAGRVHL